MAKVKKRTALTGIRNTKAKQGPATSSTRSTKVIAGARHRSADKGGIGSRAKHGKAGAKRQSARPSVTKAASGRKRAAAPSGPLTRMAVRALDPQRKCGAATTVQYLFRVDETVDGRVKAHLVFFDRHGWYCEHGRTCPAVTHARKHGGRIARAT